MEKCEHKQVQEVFQAEGPKLIMCLECNEILKVSSSGKNEKVVWIKSRT